MLIIFFILKAWKKYWLTREHLESTENCEEPHWAPQHPPCAPHPSPRWQSSVDLSGWRRKLVALFYPLTPERLALLFFGVTFTFIRLEKQCIFILELIRSKCLPSVSHQEIKASNALLRHTSSTPAFWAKPYRSDRSGRAKLEPMRTYLHTLTFEMCSHPENHLTGCRRSWIW